MSDLKIIAPLPNISKRTRLAKLIECLPKNVNYSFFGWKRLSSDKVEENGNFILNGGGYSSKKAKIMYLFWMVAVFFCCLYKFKSNDKVWALGFESAFPALLASKIKKFDVIYDDADRFSQLFNFPKIIKNILGYLEKYVSHNCLIHIIPGRERYDFTSENFLILKNTPTSFDLKKSELVDLNLEIIQKTKSYDFNIYVNGWLTDTRGIDIIKKIAEARKNICLLMAGRLDSDLAQQMLTFENVIYLGELPQYEALAYYRISNFVLTYYNPIYPINRMAEANKWGDALQYSVPVIVNKEVVTAEFLRSSNSCISVNYEDDQGLLTQLDKLIVNKEKYAKLVENTKNLQQIFPTFDEQLNNIFAKIGI